MSKSSYDQNEVMAALCVWEWLIEQHSDPMKSNGEPVNKTIDDMFEAHGYIAMRSTAVQAAVIVELCWRHADDGENMPLGCDSYDWDFVPLICRALDWEALVTNNQYGDQEWRADPERIVATLAAAQALNVEGQ